MKQFNLEEYETVKVRKKRFYGDNPDGRIIVEAVELDEKTAVFRVALFRNGEDQEKNLPVSTGWAQEFAGKGGFANKTSWCENCEESAVGRALDNAGYFGKPQCSQEEMKKVEGATAISQADRKKLYELAKKLGYSDDEFVATLKEQGFQSSAQILNKELDALKRVLEGGRDAD